MALFSIPNIEIKGISAALPKNKESNLDYDLLNEKERNLFIKTTGVQERRKAPEGMTTSDLCFVAAEKLLKDLNWRKDEISILIFVSQSSDYYLPATAVILQDRLGLPQSCMAFDIGLGCSGYVYGLSVISSILSTTGFSKGLLLVGDVSSATCAKEDKSTYPLFGDAGSVTALQHKMSSSPMNFNLRSDGSGYQSIIIPHGGIRNLASPDSFKMKEISPGIVRADLNLALNGLDVFNFSIREVPESVREFLDFTSSKTDDYDYFVMHQANKLMNETIRKKLKMEEEKVPYSITNFGNTSSASIPLTIVSQLRDQAKSESLQLLIAGFGVGLSWGVASLSLNKIACPAIIEL